MIQLLSAEELDKLSSTDGIIECSEIENIMLHSSVGGTVLFNCISFLKEANSIELEENGIINNLEKYTIMQKQ